MVIWVKFKKCPKYKLLIKDSVAPTGVKVMGSTRFGGSEGASLKRELPNSPSKVLKFE